jgi:prephenate dehydrogenase
MELDTVAIIGVGLIGGSVGMALRRGRLARCVVGIGRSATSMRQARKLGAIDRGTTNLKSGVADAELTVLCTPVNTIVEQALQAAVWCQPASIITDSGSTKSSIVARLDRELPRQVSFVGSHPLAGSEKSGVAVASADLFAGRVCVVTQTRRTVKQSLHVVTHFWQALGARVIRMTPEEHDQALAYTSHLPHLAAAALSILLPEEYKEVVATGFRDTTRIAASDPALWTAIFLENAAPLLKSLAGYERVLREFRDALRSNDTERLIGLWSQSAATRKRISEAE